MPLPFLRREPVSKREPTKQGLRSLQQTKMPKKKHPSEKSSPAKRSVSNFPCCQDTDTAGEIHPFKLECPFAIIFFLLTSNSSSYYPPFLRYSLVELLFLLPLPLFPRGTHKVHDDVVVALNELAEVFRIKRDRMLPIFVRKLSALLRTHVSTDRVHGSLRHAVTTGERPDKHAYQY